LLTGMNNDHGFFNTSSSSSSSSNTTSSSNMGAAAAAAAAAVGSGAASSPTANGTSTSTTPNTPSSPRTPIGGSSTSNIPRYQAALNKDHRLFRNVIQGLIYVAADEDMSVKGMPIIKVKFSCHFFVFIIVVVSLFVVCFVSFVLPTH
jgi:hypothetical protein